jgi:hypothetical protein
VAKRIIDGANDFNEVKCLVGIGRPIAVPTNEIQRLHILQQNLHPNTIGPDRAQARGFLWMVLADRRVPIAAERERRRGAEGRSNDFVFAFTVSLVVAAGTRGRCLPVLRTPVDR